MDAVKTEPDYCRQKPLFNSPTPPADSELIVRGHISVALWARTLNGVITCFHFNKPIGMNCTEVSKSGVSNCSWIPTADQVRFSHQYNS